MDVGAPGHKSREIEGDSGWLVIPFLREFYKVEGRILAPALLRRNVFAGCFRDN